MNKYKITASSLSYYTLEIEAESEDEAFALGKDADGGSFKPEGEADWVVTMVELVPHDKQSIFDAVYDGTLLADEWHRCAPCENETPHHEGICLVCGTQKEIT